MEISRLLKYKKKTKKALAEYVGISPDSIIGYEKGTHQPPFNVCIKMAEFLNCSLETLAGLDDNNIIDKKMLSDEKRKLVDEILNLETKDVSSVLAFIKLINEQKQ